MVKTSKKMKCFSKKNTSKRYRNKKGGSKKTKRVPKNKQYESNQPLTDVFKKDFKDKITPEVMSMITYMAQIPLPHHLVSEDEFGRYMDFVPKNHKKNLPRRDTLSSPLY